MEKFEFDVDIWVIQMPNRRFVGTDYATGGQPYSTNFFMCARWPSKQAAEIYKSAFEKPEWKILKVKHIEFE